MATEPARQPSEELHALVQELQQQVQDLQRARQRPRLFHRLTRWPLLLAAAGAVAACAIVTSAFAGVPMKIPDAKGVIHGCYSTKSGSLRVTGAVCRHGEKALKWSQVSPKKYCLGCTMNGANLSNQALEGAYLPGVSLESANLSHARLNMGYLPFAQLERGAARQVNGTSQPAPLTQLGSASFINAYMPEAILTGVDAPGASFQGADLHMAELNDGNFFNADFYGADLSMTTAKNAYFNAANLQQSVIRDMNLEGARFINANLGFAHGVPFTDGTTFFDNTICPDETNSKNNPQHTCVNHYMP